MCCALLLAQYFRYSNVNVFVARYLILLYLLVLECIWSAKGVVAI